jgi:cell division protein FtsB
VTLTRRPGLMVAGLALVLITVAAMTNVLPLRQIVEQTQEVDAARTRLTALTDQNGLLEDQVAALSTPTEIERLAREQLGYVRPGEKAFVVVEPEPGPLVYPEDAEVQTSADPSVGILQRIWAFLTGEDLVGG